MSRVFGDGINKHQVFQLHWKKVVVVERQYLMVDYYHQNLKRMLEKPSWDKEIMDC